MSNRDANNQKEKIGEKNAHKIITMVSFVICQGIVRQLLDVWLY